MEEPTLHSFGLTQERYKAAKSLHDKLSLAVVLTPLIGTALWYVDAAGSGATQSSIGYVGLLFIGVLLGLGPTLLALILLIKPTEWLLQRLAPDYRAAKQFDRATCEYREWVLRTEREFWLSLSGLAFEHELARLFVRAGYSARVTSASADDGVDIWIDHPAGKVMVQCKAHRKPVGPSVVRELYGTLRHFGAGKAILASVSGFTVGVRQYVRGKPIELMDLNDILALQRSGRYGL